ncbi:MAG: hypothetical protein ACREBC_14930, partial [Pyrinomonadaceae bacterium]
DAYCSNNNEAPGEPMISNKKHQEVLAAERAFWQKTVHGLLDRIATFQPSGDGEEKTGAALALVPPRMPIDPEATHISDYEMDDERWQTHVESNRPTNPIFPAPAVDR